MLIIADKLQQQLKKGKKIKNGKRTHNKVFAKAGDEEILQAK